MGKLIKLVITLIVLFILAGGIAFYYVYTQVGGQGTSKLEAWIGEYVVGMLESHLTPVVAFDTLDYQAPGTVVLSNLSLTTDGIGLLVVDELTLELAETPKIGKPIVIERIDLTNPTMRFLTTKSGDLHGWSNFVRENPDELPSADPAAKTKLSDSLQMRYVSILNGAIEYGTLTGTNPMRLDGITLDLNTPPVKENPGAYEIAGTFGRAGILESSFKGIADLDNWTIDLTAFDLTSALGESNYNLFPQAIQTMMIDHEVRGDLIVNAHGFVTLDDITKGPFDADITLDNGFYSLDAETILPVDHFTIHANVTDHLAQFQSTINIFNGTITTQGQLNPIDLTNTLTESSDLTISWNASGVNIQESLRTLQSDSPQYAGTIASSGQFISHLGADGLTGNSGSGTLNLTDGKLVFLPVLSDISDTVGMDGSNSSAKQIANFKDTADVQFEFMEDHIAISEVDITSSLVSVRGDGRVYYDQKLSLIFNGGPVEKVQKGLGDLGKILGAVTDTLLKYHVTGTVSEPKVDIKPLGIGAKH